MAERTREAARDVALAIDIGGTKIAAGLVTATGELIGQHAEPTRLTSGEDLYEQVLSQARRTIADAANAPQHCGVGSAGPGRHRYRLISPINIGVWHDFPLQERLATDLGMPVAIDNDAKALALAEGWRGAAKGVSDYIAIVVSTGIGGGIVLGGRLVHGADGNAGHIGQVFVDAEAPADATGAAGLLEGASSGRAIEALTGASPAAADLALRRRTGELVGRAVASVANLLGLRLAVVAGSVALGYSDDFFDAAQSTIDELARIDHARGTRIVPAALGADGPLIGAGALAWQAAGIHVLSEPRP